MLSSSAQIREVICNRAAVGIPILWPPARFVRATLRRLNRLRRDPVTRYATQRANSPRVELNRRPHVETEGASARAASIEVKREVQIGSERESVQRRARSVREKGRIEVNVGRELE